MMLFTSTLSLWLLLIVRFFPTHSCIPSHSLCIFFSYFQIFKWRTATTAPSRCSGRGLKQQGTCQRVRCWNMSWRLRPDWAQGGKGDGCSLKASTVSGDVVLTAVELVIHGKKTQLRWGYMPLSNPTHTSAWMGSAHPPMSLNTGNMGRKSH